MKRGFVVLFLISIVSIGFAQKFDGGIVLGPVISQVDGDELGGYNKVGVVTGGWVSRDFNDKWGGQFEIEWVLKGSRKPARPDLGDYSTYDLKLAYIDFPIFANYSLFQNINVRFGIIPAYMISYLEKDQYGEFESDETRPFKKINLAAAFGVNYAYNSKFSFEIRQAMDIIPFRPHPGGQATWYDYGQYNRWIEFAVFYSFRNEK